MQVNAVPIIMPPPRRGGAGALSSDRRPSSVCLMSRTSALTRKPKGLGRRNFAQGYARSHATPTPTSRSKSQKSRSRSGGILWRPPSRTACWDPAFLHLEFYLKCSGAQNQLLWSPKLMYSSFTCHFALQPLAVTVFSLKLITVNKATNQQTNERNG